MMEEKENLEREIEKLKKNIMDIREWMQKLHNVSTDAEQGKTG